MSEDMILLDTPNKSKDQLKEESYSYLEELRENYRQIMTLEELETLENSINMLKHSKNRGVDPI